MSPRTVSCDNCGAAIERRPSMIHEHNFCNNDCRMEWWRENVQPKMSRNGNRVQAELRAHGRDPAHGGEAARTRGEKIGRSNREKPRLANVSAERRDAIARDAAIAASRKRRGEDA